MRRCSWCAQPLRWWQLSVCRVCGRALNLDLPSPPVPRYSRAHAPADRLWGVR